MVQLKGAEDYPMYFGTNPKIMKRAAVLRKESTEAEKVLWEQLRRKQLYGLKFRRQHALKYFIADFYCHEAKLVIEVDGGIHNQQQQKERDIARQNIISSWGIKVIRFTNDEVMNEMENVLEKIRDAVSNKKDAANG